jgi:hypothetical protein
VQVKLAFELIKYLVPGVDVIVLAPVRPAGDEGDEILVLPNHPPLSPIAAVIVDPFL